jgi:hypothetical protein
MGTSHSCVYVIHLNNKKYYIGECRAKTKTELRCFLMHKNNLWVKKHGIVKTRAKFFSYPNWNKHYYSETHLTRNYMDSYGIKNVRGDSFPNEVFTKEQLNKLKKYRLV